MAIELNKIIDNNISDENFKQQETVYEVATNISSNNSNFTKPLKPGNAVDKIPEADMPLAKFTFMMLGFAGIVNWAIYLNANLAIFTTVYNYPAGADTVLFGYFGTGLISCLLRIFYRAINPWVTYSGFTIIIIANTTIPILIIVAKGTFGIVIVHIFLAFLGFGVSIIVSSAYAYGAMLPFNFTGYSLAGNGLAGLIGFLGWQFFTRLFFDINELDGIQNAVIGISSLSVFVTILNGILFYFLCRKPWFDSCLKTFNKTSSMKLDPKTFEEFSKDGKFCPSSPDGPRGIRPINILLKDASKFIFMGFLTFFITFTLFPEIGPYDWNGLDLNNVSIIIGSYQFFDFFGRYSGNLGEVFRFRYRTLTIGALIRLLFFPLFIYMSNANDPFFTNFALQIIIMIIFAYSHGSISTQFLATCPKKAKTIAEKAIIGICMNIASLGGMCFSKILSIIIKSIFSI